jgi:hypothetical protein
MKTIKISEKDSISNNFVEIAEYPNGTKIWYKEGKYHRLDGPAFESSDKYKVWYKEGKEHREDGPAIEYPDGTKIWYKEGKFHRLDGPAIELPDGTKKWYKEGKRHRLNGPAIELPDGTKRWYIEDNSYSPKGLSKLINSAFFLEKEKGQYNLEWLKFLTEKGIKEFPIMPEMKEYKDFKKVFKKLEGIGNK